MEIYRELLLAAVLGALLGTTARAGIIYDYSSAVDAGGTEGLPYTLDVTCSQSLSSILLEVALGDFLQPTGDDFLSLEPHSADAKATPVTLSSGGAILSRSQGDLNVASPEPLKTILMSDDPASYGSGIRAQWRSTPK